MKQRFFMFFAMILIALVLIGLNSVSYVQKEKIPDNEFSPNRSTYNTGSTGTRAFYELLTESGYSVTRWRDPIKRFKNFDAEKLSTFVVVGKVRREFSEDEKTHLLDWVSMGGKLVVIDREPPEAFTTTTANWLVTQEKETLLTDSEESWVNVDPSNQIQMVGDTKAAKPQQPTLFTTTVNAIQPSKFAASIKISRSKETVKTKDSTESDAIEKDAESTNVVNIQFPPPPPARPVQKTVETDEDDQGEEVRDASMFAPVIHFANEEKVLLVDFPYGEGQIVFLSDPYIVANGGIRAADNYQMATNIVTSRFGVIAFDEYHQGFGNNENMFLSYFTDTPVVAIFLQFAALIGLVLFSQSRRFARIVPFGEPDRLSKLEYVSAMAQLQQRTKAFDLAIENIYKDFRRRLSRLVGVDNQTATREELAKLVEERTEFDAKEIEELMFQCEDITHGEPTNKKEIVTLTSKLREVEEKLGLKRGKKNKY